jgi:hypothetical protein
MTNVCELLSKHPIPLQMHLTLQPDRSAVLLIFQPMCSLLMPSAKRQARPVTPRTTATLKPHLLWKSPFAALSRNSSNIRQLHNTAIVLASSLTMDVLEFYRKLVATAKPAEIDLVPILLLIRIMRCGLTIVALT